MTQRAPRRENIFGLIRELVSGSVALLKLEVESAKQEAAQGGAHLRAGAVRLGIGLAFGLLTLIALAALPIAIVAIWLPLWASVLIFLVLYLLLAILMVYLGIRRVSAAKESLSIPETRASVQEDVAWAKRLLKRE